MMYYHYPVLLKESVNGLNIKSSGIYADATYGGGGHSREILARLKDGQLFGIDCDEDAAKNIINDRRFVFIHGNFRFLRNYLRYYGINNVDGIIADLGVSSHFFDNIGRGFSYRQNGLLDMRMNQKSQFMAKDILNNYSDESLVRVFHDYGELKNARSLAKQIIACRKEKKFEKNGQLVKAISKFIPVKKENQYLARIFQSLRIEVNNEIENLKEFLTQTEYLIKSGGRLAVISYHSLEDRLVKNFIRWGNFNEEPDRDIYGNYKVPFSAVNKRIITPGDEEIKNNNRAKSAKLRIAEKN
jgi:16S rRNA (cytosine1402-N4)-methyltransferase